MLSPPILEQIKEGYDNGSFFYIEGNEKYYLNDSNIMSMRLKLDWVTKFSKEGGKLLDAGANFGHFLHVANDKFDAQGVEISSHAVEWSKNNLGVNNVRELIEDLPATYRSSYDVVTMWDTIEHLPSWRPALESVAKALKPKGLFFLSTPNASSAIACLLGKHWYHLHPSEHLHLFSKKNLTKILNRFGFEVLDMCSWGRYYNMFYILDRLTSFYSSPSGYFHKKAKQIKKIFSFFENKNFYFSMGDVLGICARKKG